MKKKILFITFLSVFFLVPFCTKANLLEFGQVNNTIIRWAATDDSPFTAKINGEPTATSVVYDSDTNEGFINVNSPSGNNYQADLYLFNTTRGNYRIIESTDVNTNTITTDSSIDDWAEDDDLTTLDQLFSSGFAIVDISYYVPENTRIVILDSALFDTGSAGTSAMRLAEPIASPAFSSLRLQVANVYNQAQFHIPIQNQKFAINFLNTAGVKSKLVAVSILGYYSTTTATSSTSMINELVGANFISFWIILSTGIIIFFIAFYIAYKFFD